MKNLLEQDGSSMSLISERVAILRTVSIFNEAPEEILVEAARLVVEVDVKAGQAVFEKGDLGKSMYIITSGRVRVHDGELTLNELGKTDIFGEMAALDTESRSATVTAVEDTRLICLDQENLYELIARRGSIARGIIHVLTQRLRSRMRDMADDFAYMQEFARVISAAVAVEAGIYAPESLDSVCQRTDELGQLARVFQRMVQQVDNREQRLRRQVAELRIEIDEVKKANQVAEITETEYFQQLQQKARRLRAARKVQ
jgi:CRP-like cAMP-binding protein